MNIDGTLNAADNQTMKWPPWKILITGILLTIAALVAIVYFFLHLQKAHDSFNEPLHLLLISFITLMLISSIIIFWIAQKEIVKLPKAKSQISHLEQIREENTDISNVFERVTDAFIGLDKNWRYTYLNKKGEDLHGRKVEDLIGKNIWTEFPDVVKEPFYDALHEAMQSQQTRKLELYYSTTDRWFEDLIYPSSDGISVYYHDITEKKKAEEELKRSKENYFSLINTVDGIVWEADAKTFQFSFVSEQAEKLLGYPLEQWTNEPTFWKDHIHPDDQNWAIEYCIENTRAKKNYESEYRMIAVDGRIVWLRDIVSVIVENEQSIRLRGIMVDITERKAVENNLQASEKKLQQVLSSIVESFYVIDRNCCVTMINEVAQRNLKIGWGKMVTIGTNILDYIPAEKEEPIRNSLNKVFAGEKVEYELEVSINDLPPWMLVSYAPVYDEDGTIIGASIITKDISERKKAEEQIRKSENKFRALVDTAPDATVIVNEKGIIQTVNRQTEILLDYQRGELIGQPVEILIPDGFHIKINTGAIGIGKELVALKKDGTKVPVEISLSPFHSDEGILVTASIRDITERKKAQEELQRSNTRFELITRTTNDGVWEWNLETGELWANEMHQRLYGLAPTDPVPTFNMWSKKIHPDDRDAILKRQEETLASDKNVFISEYRFWVEDIGYRDIYDRCYILRNKNGKPIRMMGSLMDITERKRAEEKLRESEERYRSLIEQASDAIIIADQKGNFIDVNSSMCLMFGYAKSELLQKNVAAIIDPEHLKTDPINFDLILTGRPILRERRMMHKNGTIVQVEVNMKMLPDGRILAIVRNIGERKKAEQAIRESEERYRTLVENAPEALVVFDIEKKQFVSVSESAIRFFKMPKEELLKMGPLDLSPEYQPDGRSSVESAIEKLNDAVAGNKPAFEWMHRDAYGKLIPCEVRLVRLPSEKGTLIRGSIFDITERKKIHDELEQSYKAIRQLTEHLQNIREEERIHIAREIHDELGQQLTVMKMDISWLNKRLVIDDDVIKQKLKSLTEMLNGTVKTVRRISSELRPSLLDDLGLVATMEWQLNEFEQRSGVKTSLVAPEAEMQLPDTVKTGLFRIFQESLTNVARHANASKVKVSLTHGEGKVLLSIEDDGKGFDKKKTAGKRTLGILGMKERTLMMGGEYEVQSIPGKGTTVLVAVPEHN